MSDQPTQEPVACKAPIVAGEQTSPIAAPEAVWSQRRSRRGLVKLGTFVIFLSACGLSVWYWGFHEREPVDDLARFQGEWKLSLGADLDPEGGGGVVAVRIKGDRWQYVVPGREGKSLSIALHEETSPKQIELTFLDPDGKPLQAVRSHGIYEIDRKSARVLVVPSNRPRPTDLNAPDSVVWVLTRVKLEQDAQRSRSR